MLDICEYFSYLSLGLLVSAIYFLLEFTEDGITTHTDSVKIPRNFDNSVNLNLLESNISNLFDYIVFKFGDRFIDNV